MKLEEVQTSSLSFALLTFFSDLKAAAAATGHGPFGDLHRSSRSGLPGESLEWDGGGFEMF